METLARALKTHIKPLPEESVPEADENIDPEMMAVSNSTYEEYTNKKPQQKSSFHSIAGEVLPGKKWEQIEGVVKKAKSRLENINTPLQLRAYYFRGKNGRWYAKFILHRFGGKIYGQQLTDTWNEISAPESTASPVSPAARPKASPIERPNVLDPARVAQSRSPPIGAPTSPPIRTPQTSVSPPIREPAFSVVPPHGPPPSPVVRSAFHDLLEAMKSVLNPIAMSEDAFGSDILPPSEVNTFDNQGASPMRISHGHTYAQFHGTLVKGRNRDDVGDVLQAEIAKMPKAGDLLKVIRASVLTSNVKGQKVFGIRISSNHRAFNPEELHANWAGIMPNEGENPKPTLPSPPRKPPRSPPSPGAHFDGTA